MAEWRMYWDGERMKAFSFVQGGHDNMDDQQWRWACLSSVHFSLLRCATVLCVFLETAFEQNEHTPIGSRHRKTAMNGRQEGSLSVLYSLSWSVSLLVHYKQGHTIHKAVETESASVCLLPSSILSAFAHDSRTSKKQSCWETPTLPTEILFSFSILEKTRWLSEIWQWDKSMTMDRLN